METVFADITDYLIRQSWQIATLFAVVAVVCMAIRKKSAHLRYLLWLLIIAKCLVPSLITVSLAILPQQPQPLPLLEQLETPEIVSAPEPVILSEAKNLSPPAPTPAPQPSIMAQLAQIRPKTWFSVIWLGGVSLYLIIVMIKAARFNRRLRRERKPLTAGMQKEIDELLDRFGVHAKLRIWLLDGIGQPFVWGLLRGSIYLPANFGQIGSREHRRGILMHEITHVARFDAAVNCLQTIAQAIFWFHPLVWLANRNIRAEREKCCDETAIARLSAAPKVYSSAIVDTLMAEYQSTQPVPSLAIAGPIKNIEDRIKTIMKPGKKFYNRPTIIAIITILLLAIIAVPTTIALTHRQAKKPEEFLPKAAEKSASEFIATLPNGVTVELVGVCEHPSQGKQWWRPDGSPMELVPYDKIENPYLKYIVEPDSQGLRREFAIRLSGMNETGHNIRFIVMQNRGAILEEKPIKNGAPAEGLRAIAALIPIEDNTVRRLEIGVADGPFKRFVSGSPDFDNSFSFIDGQQGSFTNIREQDGKTTLTVADNLNDYDHRVVAVDKSDTVHLPDNMAPMNINNTRITTVEFNNLPLESIKEFQLQTRPYELAKFKDVALWPNKKPDVQVEGEGDSWAQLDNASDEVQSISKVLKEWFDACLAQDFEQARRLHLPRSSEKAERNFKAMKILLAWVPDKQFSLFAVVWRHKRAHVLVEAHRGPAFLIGALLSRVDNQWWIESIEYGQLERFKQFIGQAKEKYPDIDIWLSESYSKPVSDIDSLLRKKAEAFEKARWPQLDGAPKEIQDIAKVLRKWFAGCLALDLKQIEATYVPYRQQNTKSLIESIRQFPPMILDWQFLPMTIMQDGDEAMAVLEPMMKISPQGNERVVPIFNLRKEEGKWKVFSGSEELLKDFPASVLQFEKTHQSAEVWLNDSSPNITPLLNKTDVQVGGEGYLKNVKFKIIDEATGEPLKNRELNICYFVMFRLKPGAPSPYLNKDREFYINSKTTDEEGVFILDLSTLLTADIVVEPGKPYNIVRFERSSDLARTKSADHIRVVRVINGVLTNSIYDLKRGIVETIRGKIKKEESYKEIVLVAKRLKESSSTSTVQVEGEDAVDVEILTVIIKAEDEEGNPVEGEGNITFSEPAAVEIINKVLAKYAGLDSYSSEGDIVTDIDMSGVDADTMPGMSDKMKKKLRESIKKYPDALQKRKQTFSVKLARPNLYCIEWSQKVHETFTNTGAVWSTGDGHYLLNRGRKTSPKDRRMALALATGVSSGAANTIPLLFLDSSTSLLGQLQEARLEVEEPIEGDLCCVIAGKMLGTTMKFWVSKETLLVRQRQQILGGRFEIPELSEEDIKKALETAGGEVTDEAVQQFREQIKSSRKISSQMKGSITETHRNIVVNKPINFEPYISKYADIEIAEIEIAKPVIQTCQPGYNPNAEDMQVLKGQKAGPSEISGIVTDQKGESIEGVLVDVWTWYPGNETHTDKNGFFELKDFEPDQKTVEIRFSKAKYSPRYILRQPLGLKDTQVVLDDKTYFEGKVFDSDSKPVPNALIKAIAGPKDAEGVLIGEIPTVTTSGDDGSYRLYVQADTYDIQVKADKGVVRLPKVDISKNEAKQLDFKLETSVTFKAKVVDSQTGKPVEGIRLFHWKHEDVDGTSNSDGLIEIIGMLPGKFEFWVEAEQCGRWWSQQCISEWNRLRIDDEETGWQRNFDGLDFDLSVGMEPVTIVTEKPVKINGEIVDPLDSPVTGATATLAKTGSGNSITGDTRYSFTTDENGRFKMVVPASKEAEYNLVAHDGEYDEWRKWANGVLQPIKTNPGDIINDIVIELGKPASVKGKVLDSSGNPVPNHKVRSHAFDKFGNRYYDPTTRTDKNGDFEIKFIRSGKHYIQAYPFWLTAEQAPGKTSNIVTLQPGQNLEGIELIINQPEKPYPLKVKDIEKTDVQVKEKEEAVVTHILYVWGDKEEPLYLLEGKVYKDMEKVVAHIGELTKQKPYPHLKVWIRPESRRWVQEPLEQLSLLCRDAEFLVNMQFRYDLKELPEEYKAAVEGKPDVQAKAEETVDVEMLTAVIKVEDEQGNPVAGSVITPDGLRAEKGGGHYFWRADRYGEPSTVITNTQGLVEVAYPKYANEKLETGSISFRINHPDFCPDRPFHNIDETNKPVVLKRGATLRVSGYLQSKENLLTEIYPQIGQGRLYSDSWRQSQEGVYETRQLPPGPHFVRLVYLPEDGLAYFSDAVRFDAEKGKTYEFKLQLEQGVRLEGTLDETVPRPVRNGRVVASAHPSNHPHHSKRPKRRFIDPSVDPGYLHWRSWREVKEDGTFVFESLPHGEVELIAICDGYISKNPPDEENMYIGIAQTWPLKDPVTRAKLKMKQTARCKIKVLDKHDKPVKGAQIIFSPNVQWHSGGAQIFATCLNWSDLLRAGGKMSPDKWLKISEVADFQATSNESGMAVVPNMPDGKRHFAVLHPQYQLPAKTGYAQFPRRVAEVELAAGQTAEVTVTMQKKGTDFLGTEDSDTRPSSKVPASPKDVSEIPDAAKWSEGKAIMGTIATAIRAWAAENYVKGTWDNDSLTPADLGFMPGDLKGTYFDENNFYWNVTYSADENDLQFTIAAIAPKEITRPAAVMLDQTGKWTIHQTIPGKARAEAARKLRRLGTALVMYAFDYDNEFPQSLDPLEMYGVDEELVWARENAEYLGKGKVAAHNGASPVPLAFDKTLLKKGEGTNVLFSDGHVQFYPSEQLEKLGISPDKEAKAEIEIESRFILVPQDSQELRDFLEAEGIELPAGEWQDNSITAPAGSEEIEKFLEEKGLLGTQTPGPPIPLLDPEQVEKLIRLTQTNPGSKMLTAPKVLVLDGESAVLSIMQQEMYISGYAESDSASEPEPITKTIDKGLTFEVLPKITDDKKNIKLDLDIELTSILGYVEDVYKGQYPYKLPEIEKVKIVSEVTIPDGKTVLMAGKIISSAILDGDDESGADRTTKELLTLITPTINPESD